MINTFLLFAVLAAAVGVRMGIRVWLSRFIDADHELRDTWRRR